MSDIAITLMQHATTARQENRLTDAHKCFADAVAHCRQANLRRELVRALKGLGQIERDMGSDDAALPIYEEAVALCREEGDPLALAHTVRHLGDLHQDAGRIELAEPCYHEALAIYRREAETAPLDLANAIRPLALLKEGVADVDEARELWAEARDLYAMVNVQAGVDECSARLLRLGGA